MDWFWQTRQRSSLASCTARAAMTGSFSVGTASSARAMRGAAKSSAATAERRRYTVSALSRRGGAGDRLGARRAHTVAAIGQCAEAAQRHQQAASPDPGHERLVVDAHRPGAFPHRLAERHVEVAEDAGRDGSLGRRHLALREIDTL